MDVWVTGRQAVGAVGSMGTGLAGVGSAVAGPAGGNGAAQQREAAQRGEGLLQRKATQQRQAERSACAGEAAVQRCLAVDASLTVDGEDCGFLPGSTSASDREIVSQRSAATEAQAREERVHAPGRAEASRRLKREIVGPQHGSNGAAMPALRRSEGVGDMHAVKAWPLAAHAGPAARWVSAGAGMLLLAACAGGTPGAGGLQNPLAGMSNPFSGPGGAISPGPRIGAPFGTAGAAGGATASGAVSDPFAGQGVKQPDIPQAGTVKATAKPASSPPPASTTPAGAATGTATAAPTTTTTTATAPTPKATAPTSHTVAAGETAWSIARKYGVSVTDLASANALPAETMTVRTGQKLAIPAGTGAAATTATVSAPGAGSPTPRPPSASRALPREDTAPASAKVDKPSAPDLGATRTKASGGSGKLQMPVSGSIVRAYAKGRNEGIDLSAPTGTTVKAAGSGTVAAITRDTDGVPIVVMRHDGQLMTVYAGLDNLSVAKGDRVSAGQSIGKSSKAGVLHFEVRQGFESVDPEGYLR